MKYLLRHRKETILTAVMIVVLAYVLYDGIANGTPVQSIVESITMVLVWYFNMPTSIEGEIGKIELKQRKAVRNCAYNGASEPKDAEVK